MPVMLVGSICPVEPGRMRNSWHPRHKAEYIIASTFQGLKPKDIVAERDFNFGIKPKEEPGPRPGPNNQAPEEESMVDIHTKFLVVCPSYVYLTPLRRLTTKAATASFGDIRCVLAPESHILQDSHQHP